MADRVVRAGNPATASRSIAFWRDWDKRRPYVIATTKTEDPEAPIELVRPFGDGSGDEVLVSLTPEEWGELIGFIGDHLAPGDSRHWSDGTRVDEAELEANSRD